LAKIKYLVMGIDNQHLGGLVGALIQGEISGDAELLCCNGTPQAFKVEGSGQVVEVPFGTLLSELVRKERGKLARGGKAELKLLPKTNEG
jgi:hypothetical protein